MLIWVSRKQYEELWKFCKQIQHDCDKLSSDNKKLRKELYELLEKEKKNGRED